VSTIIKKVQPSAIVTGNPEPPRTGAFEVTIDGDLVFSKFSTDKFPTEPEIKSWIS